MSKVTIQVEKPILSIKAYAQLVNESEKSISNQIDDGMLPYVQPKPRGKRYINMTALLMLTLEAEEKKPTHNRAAWN